MLSISQRRQCWVPVDRKIGNILLKRSKYGKTTVPSGQLWSKSRDFTHWARLRTHLNAFASFGSCFCMSGAAKIDEKCTHPRWKTSHSSNVACREPIESVLMKSAIKVEEGKRYFFILLYTAKLLHDLHDVRLPEYSCSYVCADWPNQTLLRVFPAQCCLPSASPRIFTPCYFVVFLSTLRSHRIFHPQLCTHRAKRLLFLSLKRNSRSFFTCSRFSFSANSSSSDRIGPTWGDANMLSIVTTESSTRVVKSSTSLRISESFFPL